MVSGGSHPKYSAAVRAMLESHIQAGVRSRDIAKAMKVSESFVHQLRSNYEVFGTVSPPYPGVQGRPRLVHHEAEEGVYDFLLEYPMARRDEVCDFLSDEYDIQCSVETAGRVIKRINMTTKTAQRIHAEQDPALRATYLAEVARTYSAEQIVAIDESAVNERIKDRRYGWSPKGMPCRVKLSGKKSKRWSILPALGIGGFLYWEIYHGSYNADRFNDFIERLLPKMTPFPGPRSVLLLDNARTHHNTYLAPICAAAGVQLLYLPPYSPDLNPIELSFHELKEWMRKERELSYEFGPWYEGFIHLGLMNICSEETAQGYFRQAGFHISDDMRDANYSTI
jgi:transposase